MSDSGFSESGVFLTDRRTGREESRPIFLRCTGHMVCLVHFLFRKKGFPRRENAIIGRTVSGGWI